AMPGNHRRWHSGIACRSLALCQNLQYSGFQILLCNFDREIVNLPDEFTSNQNLEADDVVRLNDRKFFATAEMQQWFLHSYMVLDIEVFFYAVQHGVLLSRTFTADRGYRLSVRSQPCSISTRW